MRDLKSKYASYNLEIFDNLCDSVRHFIFKTISTQPSIFFYVCGLDEDILRMSPIEQMFLVSNGLYETNITNKKSGITSLEYQKKIKIKDKTYIADFYIDNCVINNTEVFLKRPVIIELDGYEYHSNKQQVNHDYQRENDLKLAGYDIIRFTGSQVYNEPFKCIEIVCDYLNKASKGE